MSPRVKRVLFLVLLVIVLFSFLKDSVKDGFVFLSLNCNLLPLYSVVMAFGWGENFYGKDYCQGLLWAIEFENEKALLAFVGAGGKLNQQIPYGETPLIIGVRLLKQTKKIESRLAFLSLLLKAGADVNYCTRFRETPLLIAVQENLNDQVIKFLLENGAVASSTDNKGDAPIHLAGIRGDDNSFRIIEHLVHFGADLNQPDCLGRNILHYAYALNFSSKRIQDLISLGANPLQNDKLHCLPQDIK